MAQKRMISLKVIDTDAFLDMSLSAQALYFHLLLRADDDGFVGNPKRLQEYVHASVDDLNMLLAKRFILKFDNGVIVIKHWRMHNTIQKDRYIETDFIDEKRMLDVKEDKSYRLLEPSEISEKSDVYKMYTKCIQNVSTDIDIDLDSDLGLDIDSDIDSDSERDIQSLPTVETVSCADAQRTIVEEWNKLSSFGIPQITKIISGSQRSKWLNLRLKEYGLDNILKAISLVGQSEFLRGRNERGWVITFDWFIRPNNFPKVIDGNYSNKKTEFARSVDTNNPFLQRLMEENNR